MKKLIFIIPLLFISCIKNDITSIIVQNDQSTEVNLFNGEYIVRLMNKKDAKYNFLITEKEIAKIRHTYNKYNIRNYENELLITNYDETIIMPVSYITYIINFSDGSKQIFKINMDLKKNPLDKEIYKDLKFFVDNIDKIIKSKKEITNAVKSDYKYM